MSYTLLKNEKIDKTANTRTVLYDYKEIKKAKALEKTKAPEKSPIAADVKTMFEQILTSEQIPDDSKHIFNPKFQSKLNTTNVQEAIDDTNKSLNSFEKVKRDDTVR